MGDETMEKVEKRKYERVNSEEYRSWNKPPPIIYDEKGNVVDRKAYDSWYSANKRKYSKETQKEKNARYDRYSEEYWTAYCIENGLDPENWRETKAQVQEKRLREKRIRWY